MSISRLMLRIATVKALTGRTLAKGNVLDSDLSEIAEFIKNNPQPVIVVYTDDHPGNYDGGKDLFSTKSGHVLLTLQFSIAGSTAINAEGNPTEEAEPAGFEFFFPNTSAGLELTLDMMERQALCALVDPANPWADVWKSISLKLGKRQSLRGGTSQRGARYAVRQLSIEVGAADDPVPGKPLSARWQSMVDLVAADPDPDFADLARLITDALVGKPMDDVNRQIMQLGLTLDVARRTGTAPIVDGASAPITEVNVYDVEVPDDPGLSTEPKP